MQVIRDHPATGPVGTPTDKPIVERTLGSIKTLFGQNIGGYRGSSVEQRGKNADQQAHFSLPELRELLDQWIIVGWQRRKHEGLRDPFNPKRILTPMRSMPPCWLSASMRRRRSNPTSASPHALRKPQDQRQRHHHQIPNLRTAMNSASFAANDPGSKTVSGMCTTTPVTYRERGHTPSP